MVLPLSIEKFSLPNKFDASTEANIHRVVAVPCRIKMDTKTTVAYHVDKFYTHQALPRKEVIAKRVNKVGQIVSQIMKDVTAKEPRYIK